MTSRSGAPDPALDPRADFDYQGGPRSHPDLAETLDTRVDGEVRFDQYTRQAYATDASLYQIEPVGVVRPKHTEDVATVVSVCRDRGIAVLPRGAGTSLAGQTTNEAVVLDFKAHMDGIQSVDPESSTVRAQPGITLAALDDAVASHDLQYAPDPAWGDKSVLGGAIGNNSTGAHSLRYEKADAYLESAEVVLASGAVVDVGWMDLTDLRAAADPEGDLEARLYAELVRIIDEHGDTITEVYPDLHRNVSGYNLDLLIEEAETYNRVNVARIFAGSEGTLGIITEATVALEPVPEATAVALLTYDDLGAALGDLEAVLAHDPAALEVMDEQFLDLAGTVDRFEDLIAEFPDGTGATLLVEFDADSEAGVSESVEELIADRVAVDTTGRANGALEAHTSERQAAFWDLRKAGLPILLSETGTVRPWPFIEDTAIPVSNLGAFVADVQVILDSHDTSATFYAHAGPGVLHIRPFLDLQTQSGVDAMADIADAITDLVVTYDGAVSGEHGDGRARTQWNRKRYGEDVWELFRSLKRRVDPDWILNPGPVGGAEDGPPDMTESLRFGPGYELDLPVDPELNWDNENGMRGMVELCHGCGGCTGFTETTGGVMCPTFRATGEEIQSTRARANLLRTAMDGTLPADPLDEEFIEEVLSLCVSCQGCRRDCPSGVDMAKLKAELTHAYHQREGASLRSKLFANVDRLAGLASTVSPISKTLASLPGADWLLERTLGIASERTLPTFEGPPLQDWFAARGGCRVPASEAEHRVILFPDTYTNYSRQHVGKAAVRVLEAAGVHVRMAERSDSGRPAYSKSFIDLARQAAEQNVAALEPRVREGWTVLTTEPSDAVMFQHDYLDLLDGPAVSRLAEHTYGVMEFLDRFDLVESLSVRADGETVTYHGHCHQKAEGTAHHAARALDRAGFDVEELDSGCCGMAGTFGYEAEHYSMSRAIGQDVFELIQERDGDVLVAPGGSCRTQFEDSPVAEGQPPHPIELLADSLVE
ncbi:FAD-binding and (Fe-S)-binding domain-containing protein [Halodesulfurarchaeum formicicum]|uniref:D-lactate dehydrogenase (cytochrome) n=1 Tax=Halodesulfurarchaeum formicicum TaxID=1873524 RepID=A0A1J1AAH4_9EURY|nr:FAD-binding oxidoreductase [Halodesulfurarchaeum formicicum]APE94727.1 oxidoreductase (glycolate oxidase iron-sulfur subunit) [Halodesulfurarchaeum formicicum]